MKILTKSFIDQTPHLKSFESEDRSIPCFTIFSLLTHKLFYWPYAEVLWYLDSIILVRARGDQSRSPITSNASNQLKKISISTGFWSWKMTLCLWNPQLKILCLSWTKFWMTGRMMSSWQNSFILSNFKDSNTNYFQ